MPNLEYLYLIMKEIKIKDGMFKTCSAGLISLQKLKYLKLFLDDCTLKNISDVVYLWENINKLQELKELIFRVNNKDYNFEEPISAFSEGLQTKNDSL